MQTDVLCAHSGHQSRRNPSGSSARCLDFADTEETRPRAEDASRVPRRADPVAECDLAEVFATGFDLPANLVSFNATPTH